MIVLFLVRTSPLMAHGTLQWTSLGPAEIQAILATSAAFEYAVFLSSRLRAAKHVQRAGDHLRFDHDGDGRCEGWADLVGRESARWYVVLRRESRETTTAEVGHEQVDTVYMDWSGNGRTTLVLNGHTPTDRVKTRLFILYVDLNDNGVYDLRLEVRPPATFAWVVSYQYQDAAQRPELADSVAAWRDRLGFQLVRNFYEAEYFFHHGPEFAASAVPEKCP
jgi:hypothetical protein